MKSTFTTNICITIVSLAFVTALPIAVRRAPSSQHHARDTTESVGFDANLDIYGFGVRLGFYLQWLGAVLSKWFRGNPEALRDLLDENGILQLAIFIATILLCTGGTESVHAVEIVILLHIFFGSTYIIMFDTAISDSFELISSFWGIISKYAIAVGMAALGVWFWFVGIDNIAATPGTGNYAFFFAKVAIQGHFLGLFRAISIINLVVWWHAFLGCIIERIVYLHLFKKQDGIKGKKMGVLQVLKELSVPSAQKFSIVPPDVILFRQYVRLLLQPDLEKLSDELRPYTDELNDYQQHKFSTSGNIRLPIPSDPAVSPLLELVVDYMRYMLCSLTARTCRHLQSLDTKTLTAEQQESISKFEAFIARHEDLLHAPRQDFSPLLKFVLFLLGMGPTIRRLLTPKISSKKLIFVDAFPAMVDFTIGFVEPNLARIFGKSASHDPPAISFGGIDFKVRYEGPFMFPQVVMQRKQGKALETQKKTGKTRHPWRYIKKVLSPLLRRVFRLWSLCSAKVLQLFALVISIAAIELIIRWDDITNSYNIRSTGQVLPLILGAAGLWKIVFEIVLSRYEDGPKEKLQPTLTELLTNEKLQQKAFAKRADAATADSGSEKAATDILVQNTVSGEDESQVVPTHTA